MNSRSLISRLLTAARAVRLGRLVLVLAAALLAGLLSDWARDEQRLVFPRPLPPLQITPAQP